MASTRVTHTQPCQFHTCGPSPLHRSLLQGFVQSRKVLKNILLGNAGNYEKYLVLFCVHLKIHKWYRFIW